MLTRPKNLILILTIAGCASLAVLFVLPLQTSGAAPIHPSVSSRPAPSSTTAAPAPATSQAAPAGLVLLDDFSNPARSDDLWVTAVAGAGSVSLEKGRAVLDMPDTPNAGSRSQLFSKQKVRLKNAGDVLRVTWNMHLLEDRLDTYALGLIVGDPDGPHVLAAQTGQKANKPEYLPSHNIIVTGIGDNIDHGAIPLHFDFVITLKDPATGECTLDLHAYKIKPALDKNPDLYSKADPVGTIAGAGFIPMNTDSELMFYNTVESTQPDPHPQGRAKFSISHIYTQLLPAKPKAQPER